jgi:hypothetical protein
MDDRQLQREIETIQEIVRVRLRRYNRELRELERDLRELKALQRARRKAPVPEAERPQVSEEVPP